MKKPLALISVFVLIIIISSFLAPIIYQHTDFKFHRILSRCIMVGVLISMIFYFQKMDRSSIGALFSSYGLKWDKKNSLRSIIQGFVVVLCVLAVLMGIEMFLGARIFKLNIKDTFILQLIEYIFAAFIIAFIEEFFFRGMIFNKAKSISLASAFIITNAFYSIVHFLKPGDIVVLKDNPTVIDSFRVIGACLQPFLSPITILPGFIGLLLFGLVLNYTYWRTNSLYHAIGIHAGCVFFLKADGFFLHINHDMPVLIYGDKNIYTGILGWVFIIIIGLIMRLIFRRTQSISS